MEQEKNRSQSAKTKPISTLRVRGATMRGPTLAILVVSLAMAALAMVLLLTKFYTTPEPRRVFNLNGIEIADSKQNGWVSSQSDATAID
jgi:hypothetical protein